LLGPRLWRIRVDIFVSFLKPYGKWFQFFSIKYDVGYGFVIYSLYYVEVHSFYF
jgi:hypothetical protein